MDLKLVTQPTNDLGELLGLNRYDFARYVAEHLENVSTEQLRALLAQAVERLLRAPADEEAKLAIGSLQQASRSPTVFVGKLTDEYGEDDVLIVYNDGLLKLYVADSMTEYINVAEQLPDVSPFQLPYALIETLLSHAIKFPDSENLILLPIPKRSLPRA